MAYSALQRRQHIQEIQQYLHGLSHIYELPPVIPDGVYGPNTVSAVLAFQKLMRLRPTGEVNTETWNTIVSSFQDGFQIPLRAMPMFPIGTDSYSLGSTGGTIYIIQGVLQALHSYFPALPSVSVNGIFDDNTADAVQQFQTVTALPISGSVTPDTWYYLLSALDNMGNVSSSVSNLDVTKQT